MVPPRCAASQPVLSTLVASGGAVPRVENGAGGVCNAIWLKGDGGFGGRCVSIGSGKRS